MAKTQKLLKVSALVFLVTAIPTSVLSQTSDPAIVFWESISDSKNPSLFEGFVKRYPSHPFTELADIRFRELTGRSLTRTPESAISDNVRLPELTPVVEPKPTELVERPTIQEFAARVMSRTMKRSNVRAGPSRNARILKTVDAGTPIQVNSTNGDWHQITLQGVGEAYIFRSLVEESVPDFTWLEGVKSPSVEPIEPIYPQASADCWQRPIRSCLLYEAEAAFKTLSDKDYRHFPLASLSGVLFQIGDIENGLRLFERVIGIATSLDADEYNNAADNRTSALQGIASTLTGYEANRPAMFAVAKAMEFVPGIRSKLDYSSDDEERIYQLESMMRTALNLGLTAQSKRLETQAVDLASNLPGNSINSAHKQRAKKIDSISNSFINQGMISDFVRLQSYSVPHIKRISYITDTGIESSDRARSLGDLAENFADIGYINEAIELAGYIPHEAERAKVFAYLSVTAEHIDAELSDSIAEKALQIGSVRGRIHVDAIVKIIGSGKYLLAERYFELTKLSKWDLYKIGQVYADIGKLEKAKKIAAMIEDETYRSWVYREIVERIAEEEGLDPAIKFADNLFGVSEQEVKTYLYHGANRYYQRLVEKKLDAGEWDEAFGHIKKFIAANEEQGASLLNIALGKLASSEEVDGLRVLFPLTQHVGGSYRIYAISHMLSVLEG
nr:SH3 domain-containing protein [uncultured Roseibium sp.]